MIISVDPGLKGCGVAVWGKNPDPENAHPALLWGGYVKNPNGTVWHSMVGAVDAVVRARTGFLGSELAIEMPQAYASRAHQKGDQNDLIRLAGLVGAFCYMFDGRDGHTLYLPAQWKKQITKEVSEMRTKKKLTSWELQNIELPSAKGLAHNFWDAAGIGMFHIGRHAAIAT